jgi:hypothetical protein
MSNDHLPAETLLAEREEAIALLRDVINAYDYVATEPDEVEVARAFLNRIDSRA